MAPTSSPEHLAVLTDKCNVLAKRLEDIEGKVVRKCTERNGAQRRETLGESDSRETTSGTLLLRSAPAGAYFRGTDRLPEDGDEGENEEGDEMVRWAGHVAHGDYEHVLYGQGESARVYPFRAHSSSDALRGSPTPPKKPLSSLKPPRRMVRPKVSSSQKAVTSSTGGRNNHQAGQGISDDQDDCASHCERVENEIIDRFGVVRDGLAKLSNVFTGASEILEQRVNAVTAISRFSLPIPSRPCPAPARALSPTLVAGGPLRRWLQSITGKFPLG